MLFKQQLQNLDKDILSEQGKDSKYVIGTSLQKFYEEISSDCSKIKGFSSLIN